MYVKCIYKTKLYYIVKFINMVLLSNLSEIAGTVSIANKYTILSDLW